MFLTSLEIDGLQRRLLGDLGAFAPELILCMTIILMLLLRLQRGFSRIHMGWLALGFTTVAFLTNLALLDADLDALMPQVWFTGLLAYDRLTIYLRAFLIGFAVLLIWLSLLTGIPDREDSADFYTLVLGATIGMCLMASANHLLMIYLGVEMASLPSYALAGFLKGRRQSSEAALKYVVYGGGASGIMLYGISLFAGKFGTAYLPDVALGFSRAFQTGAPSGFLGYDPILVLGSLFILIGMGFKLAAFPFHFWCPDVFEGASAEVAGFLSVASKGAAIAMLGRFALVCAGLSEYTTDWPFTVWVRVVQYLGVAIGVAAALTATFGNLAAYLQTNLKRLLAYSTIAHAGYMMMALATMTREGLGAALFYLVVYLAMNLGAFAVVAFLRNQTGSEDLASFRGLIQRSPFMVLTLAVFLLSLLGLPPLAGFAAKFQVFRTLFEAGQVYTELKQPVFGNFMYGLLVIGGINTVLSAVYYLKVLKVMILDRPVEDIEGKPPVPLREPVGAIIYTGLLSLVILLIGINPSFVPHLNLWDKLANLTGTSAGVASKYRPPPPEFIKPLPIPMPGGG